MQYRRLAQSLVLFLALGVQSRAQLMPGGPPPDDKTAGTPVPESKIAPDAPVITIDGFCDDRFLPGSRPLDMADSAKSETADASAKKESVASASAEPGAACKTVITRARFEILVNALSPKMPPGARARLAERYPDMLLHAEKIRELGVENDPNAAERIKFSYLQILGKYLDQFLQQKANDVSDADVEKYYKEHPASFQRVELMRIFILNHKVYPDSTPLPPGASKSPRPTQSKEQLAADEAAMKAEAEKIRKEALAGGNFEKLQDRAYKFAQDPDDTPEVKLGKMTPDQVPAEYQKAIFDSPVGQISELEPASNGWHIFKVVSKDTVPLSEAKPIVQKLRMKESQEALKTSIKVQLNSEYFATGEEQTQPAGWR